MALLSGLWSKILVGVAFVGLLVVGISHLIGIGRDKERYAATTKAMRQAKEARDVEARVDGADPDERERLRSKWTRGG